MDDFSPAERAVLSAVAERLADGPMDLLALVDHLETASPLMDAAVEVDADPVDFLEDLLMDVDDLWTTKGGLVVSFGWLNNGAIFTKRITERDLALPGPVVGDDLILLGVEFSPVPLRGGGEIRQEWVDRENSFDSYLSGLPDWPGDVTIGDLLACGIADDEFVWWIEDAPADGSLEADALREAFDQQYRPNVGADLWLLGIECMCSHLSLFRTATPPLTELLAGVGLGVEGDSVGRADEAWVPPGVAAEEAMTEQLAEAYGFESCCRAAFETVKSGYSDFVLRDGVEDPAAIGAALDHGLVAPAFLTRQNRYQSSDLHHHLAFLEAVISGTPKGSTGALLLRGERRLEDADVLGAEQDFAEAVRLDPNNQPAREELAWIAADRGEGRKALDLLGPAARVTGPTGEPHPFAELFGPRKQGRNEACACGSGRKYKQCCLHHPKLDESQRLRFLSSRVVHFITRARSHVGVALSATDPDDPDDFYGRLEDPFIIDLTCFEGGELERYLDERGPLLTDEDRLEFERWLETRRELYEVESAEPGATLGLRNLRSGERTTVTEHAASLQVGPGVYLVTRIVPTPTTDRLIGWTFPVGLRERERLLRLTDRLASADEWASWYRATRTPPEIRNREGEEMVGCHGEFWPSDGDWPALIQRVDELYEKTDDRSWIDTVDLGGGEMAVRASLSIEGDVLAVTANSNERYERVLAALPPLHVIIEERAPIGSPAAFSLFMEKMQAELTPPIELDTDALGLAEAWMRDREEKWLDEPVPMLDGCTPREAAADPTRVADLEKLLDLYARTPSGGPGLITYDVARLRELLGL